MRIIFAAVAALLFCCAPDVGSTTLSASGGDSQQCEDTCGPCDDPPACGDSVCDGNEDCTSCTADCGECPPECGNGTCEVGEDCEVCAKDCGNCAPTCGDGECDSGESCDACPRDCGLCPAPDPGPAKPGADSGVDPEVTVTGGQLGGCSTGGNTGVLGFLLVAGAMLLMRRKQITALLATLFILVLPTVASAQVTGDPGNFKLERFEMAMDNNSIITVEGAEVGLRGSGGFSYFLGYADDPLVIQENTGDGFNRVGSLVGHQLSASIGGYLVLADNLAFGITIPMVLSQGRDADDLTGLNDLKGGGLSDPRFTLKYQMAEQQDHGFNLAIGANATVPRAIVESDYLGSGAATLSPFAALSRSYGSWRWAMNAGFKLQEDGEVVDLDISDEAFARMGIAKSWGHNEVSVAVLGTSAVDDMFTNNTSYSEMMASYSRRHADGVSSFVGAGTGLNDGFGAPDWRAFVGMRLDLDAAASPVRHVEEVVTEEEEPPATKVPEKVTIQIVSVPDTFFVFDKYDLLPQYKEKLEAFAKKILEIREAHPELNLYLSIEGHTDSLGKEKYNDTLSYNRALTVYNTLVDAGLPSWLFSGGGFGEGMPLKTNATVEGRATNRRVEIYLSGDEEWLELYEFTLPDMEPDGSTYDDFGELDID